MSRLGRRLLEVYELEPVWFPLDVAAPLGLEAVPVSSTNSVRHF